MRKKYSNKERKHTNNECNKEHNPLTISSIEWSSYDISNHASDEDESWYPFKCRCEILMSIYSPEKVLHPGIEEGPESDETEKWEEWATHREEVMKEEVMKEESGNIVSGSGEIVILNLFVSCSGKTVILNSFQNLHTIYFGSKNLSTESCTSLNS